MQLSSLLFVYGTLMRNHRRHRWLLQYADYLGAASIAGVLYRLPGKHYPGAVPSALGRERVHGELYRLTEPARTLRMLDRVEDCQTGEFRRDLVKACWNGQERKAWTYFYALPLADAERIPNGRYHRRVP